MSVFQRRGALFLLPETGQKEVFMAIIRVPIVAAAPCWREIDELICQ